MDESQTQKITRQYREEHERKVLLDTPRRLHEWLGIPTTIVPEVRPEWIRRT
jgi:hypothetical protein